MLTFDPTMRAYEYLFDTAADRATGGIWGQPVAPSDQPQTYGRYRKGTVMACRPRNPHAHANPAMAAALRELRRSGAAGAHADSRQRRSRDRSSARRAAIRDFN